MSYDIARARELYERERMEKNHGGMIDGIFDQGYYTVALLSNGGVYASGSAGEYMGFDDFSGGPQYYDFTS